MKKIYLLVIMIFIVSIMTGSTAFADGSSHKINVTVNNKTVKYEAKPYVINDEVMVPVKRTSEALGAKVEWDKKTKTEWVHLGMMHVELTVGKSEFYIHRDADFSGIPQTVKLSSPIKSVKGDIFVPGKVFFENLGMTVTWDSKNKLLSIVNNNGVSNTISYTEITKDNISRIKDVSKWFNKYYKKSGIHYTKHDGVMYVLIGAGKKPTGGYTIGISSISYDNDSKAYITAFVKSPTPDMMVTQAITYPYMLIKIEGYNLKSVKGEVQEIIVDTVPAQAAYDVITYDNIKDNDTLKNWYNQNYQKQGINYVKDGKYIYVLIGAGEKPTGGYLVNIDSVFYSSPDTITVNARVTPPGDNVRVMMMITYPSTLIRIESDTVKAVVGDILDTTKAPTKEKWITMDSTTVTKMELYSLDQVKIRDITGKEEEDIMKSFNEATLDPNPYIEMIAGNILKVTTNDGYVLTFTSYGSKTNVIVSFAKDGETRTFHLVAPGIAELLLK